MKALIYGNFSISKIALSVFSFIFLLAGLITAGQILKYLYIIYLIFFGIIYCNTVFIEEKSKFINREMILDKKTFINSRYVIILIYFLIMFCLALIDLLINGKFNNFDDSIIVISHLTISSIISVPIVLKYGAKYVYASFATLLGLCVIAWITIPRSILEIEFIKYLYVTDWIQYVFLIIATLVCYLISIRISYKILDVK